MSQREQIIGTGGRGCYLHLEGMMRDESDLLIMEGPQKMDPVLLSALKRTSSFCPEGLLSVAPAVGPIVV